MQIRLILLDFDGTLADTRRANTLAYVATLREAGYTLTEEEYAAKYFGMRCNEFLTRYGIADPGSASGAAAQDRALPRVLRHRAAQPPAVGVLQAVPGAGRPRMDRINRQPRQYRQCHAPFGDHGRGTADGGARLRQAAPAWTKREWSELARVRPQRAWTEPVWKERQRYGRSGRGYDRSGKYGAGRGRIIYRHGRNRCGNPGCGMGSRAGRGAERRRGRHPLGR